MEIAAYRAEMFDGIETLWDEAFQGVPPRGGTAGSIADKMGEHPELFLVGLDGGAVIATVMAGYDGHRGWLYSVAVRASHRRRGIGAMLVREAVARLTALGCRKVNLQVLPENAAVAAFYESLGFAVEERISMGMALPATIATPSEATIEPLPEAAAGNHRKEHLAGR